VNKSTNRHMVNKEYCQLGIVKNIIINYLKKRQSYVSERGIQIAEMWPSLCRLWLLWWGWQWCEITNINLGNNLACSIHFTYRTAATLYNL